MKTAASRRSFAYAAIGLPAIAAALFAVKTGRLDTFGDNRNFKVVYEKPTGWKELPHGPQTLFLFQEPRTGVLLRGAVNQIVADVNPTPELDTDGIAQYYVDRTHENMKDWQAKMGEKVKAKDGEFRIIERERKDKKVVTAYAVKGNTTLLVSISGGPEAKVEVDRKMPEFKEYLSSIGLVETYIPE
ncbi:MAG TPA: hypothetical protein VGE01_10520 [Fimbriimonas sp.]